MKYSILIVILLMAVLVLAGEVRYSKAGVLWVDKKINRQSGFDLFIGVDPEMLDMDMINEVLKKVDWPEKYPVQVYILDGTKIDMSESRIGRTNYITKTKVRGGVLAWGDWEEQ
ncbi:MAG: hypothetical protein ACYS7Y_30090 [Planctomycetota bacterium]|jgi:hypothetical protein